MFLIRIVFFLIFLLNLSCFDSFAQTKILSKKEIVTLIKRAKTDLESTNFEKSLATSRLVLYYATLATDDDLIASSYNTIAKNYAELVEIDKAIFFYKKGLSYADKTQNDTIKTWINNNLGNMYCFEKKQYKKGIKYYKQSLNYSEKLSDTTQIIFTKLNMAWAYFDNNQFENGLPYLEFVNSYFSKKRNDNLDVVLSMLNGMYYSYKRDNAKANFYFLNAIELGKDGKERSDLSFAHNEYSKFLLKIGKYKEAYENLTLYNKITEELYNEDKLKKASLVGINLELDEYKREIDKIENEKDLQYQSLRKSKVIVVLFVIVLFVLLILIYTLFKNNNFKKKANAELRITNAELIHAKEKAEEASLLKSQFVSTISHELRTPLYGVIGITDMLVDEHRELANSPLLHSLKFSAKYLLSLVNDILHINKIEENRIVLERLTFSIHEEINMIKNSLSFLALSNNNVIKLEFDPKIPDYLIGDKLRLEQIIINLVSNALKFTNNGEVIISVNLVKVENKSHYLEFKIKDNGIGIADLDQGIIFDKFVQVGRKADDYQGTGLGLSIVKRLLELFGSSISIESTLGVGTTFTFTIAFDYDLERANEIINNIQVDLRPDEAVHVLVVEDNRINQLVTKKALENNNYHCTLVDNGFSALEILEKTRFDVILMDINMPLMNGFEATRKIRQKGILTPIIALTAFGKEEIKEEAISVGIDDILIKPFEPVKLSKLIHCLLFETKNA